MRVARQIASLPAIGGLTAAIALEAALATARGDELSDMQAQIQLLQQRIDQLAKEQQVGQQPGEQNAAVLGGPVVAGAPAIAGTFPRSFMIPGTNTSLAISGYIKFDAAEWFRGGSTNPGNGNNPSAFGFQQTGSLPLDLKGPPGTIFATPTYNKAAQSNWIFHASAAESRLRVETRTPTDWGQVGTVLEFDFFDCGANATGSDCQGLDDGTSPVLPRLRLAYATLGGFFAGQGYVPTHDAEARPETLDNDPAVAGVFGFTRTPWIGYTWQLPHGLAFQLAGVTPSTGFYGPLGAAYDDCDLETNGSGAETQCAATGYPINPNKTTMPDLNLVLRDEQPWGHVQFAFVGQRLTLNDGAFLNQNFFGYGGGISGNVRPGWLGWEKDNFGFNFFAGPGLGHYANPPTATEPYTTNALATNWGLVGTACDVVTGVGCYGNAAGTSTGGVTAANAALVRTQTVFEYGAEANYQHWWTENLRSTVEAGSQTQNIPTSLVTVAAANVPFDMVSSNANALQYNRTLITAHANLLWSPVSFIDTGFEFMWGHRLTILGASGSQDVLDYAFKVKF
jgi:Porin subfamily